MPRLTHSRDEILIFRLAKPLKRVLERVAAQEHRHSTADLAREILVNWAVEYLAEKEPQDGPIP